MQIIQFTKRSQILRKKESLLNVPDIQQISNFKDNLKKNEWHQCEIFKDYFFLDLYKKLYVPKCIKCTLGFCEHYISLFKPLWRGALYFVYASRAFRSAPCMLFARVCWADVFCAKAHFCQQIRSEQQRAALLQFRCYYC